MYQVAVSPHRIYWAAFGTGSISSIGPHFAPALLSSFVCNPSSLVTSEMKLTKEEAFIFPLLPLGCCPGVVELWWVLSEEVWLA